jgi:hypothetical protein
VVQSGSACATGHKLKASPVSGTTSVAANLIVCLLRRTVDSAWIRRYAAATSRGVSFALGGVQVGNSNADSDFDLANGDQRCPRQRWRRRAIPRTRRCDEFGCVHAVFVCRGDAPTRRFLGVVAPFALPQPIGGAGRSAAITRCGVITMPNRRITVGSATRSVPHADKSGQTLGKEPRSRLFQLYTYSN